MKNKKLFYAMLCALGGGMVGFFSSRLTDIYGSILFGIGVGLIVYSIVNLNK